MSAPTQAEIEALSRQLERRVIEGTDGPLGTVLYRLAAIMIARLERAWLENSPRG